MRRLALAALILGLAACGEDVPPPVPVTPTPAPQAALPPPAPAPAPQAKTYEEPRPDANKELAGRVKQALEGEAKIQAAAIDVTAAKGAITLWGTAATDDERARAARVAEGVEGVKSVDNRIAVVQGS